MQKIKGICYYPVETNLSKRVMSSQKDFEHLFELSNTICSFSSIAQLLSWDQETYMPKGGGEARSHQLAALASHIHKEKTSLKFKNALAKLISLKTGKVKAQKLSTAQKIALREWRKDFIKDTKIPNSFVKNFSKLTSQATMVWIDAKKNNSFKDFEPYLEKIFEMSREKAKILGYKDHPYDALLNDFEPGMTSAKISQIFSKLKKKLVSLLKKVQDKKQIDNAFLKKPFLKEKQIEFGNVILNGLKIEKEHARLDESAHPFTISLHPTDTRFTTWILEFGVMSNIMSILHEAGHAFYEMGLPVEYWGTPLCEATSLGIHESQSRWWETIIGRSMDFWHHFYSLLQRTYVEEFKDVSLKRFYKAINVVEPSFIRVESDEMTYCLHIILRFEMEKELLKGTLKVKDIPDVWNEKMKDLFGITPPDDRLGCLQDIHWAAGLVGYFPTYALGNLYAAQFFQVFEKEHPHWAKRVQKGDLPFIREWLKENIHSKGRMFSSEELCKNITKKALSEDAYIKYLTEKYSEIYDF